MTDLQPAPATVAAEPDTKRWVLVGWSAVAGAILAVIRSPGW